VTIRTSQRQTEQSDAGAPVGHTHARRRIVSAERLPR